MKLVTTSVVRGSHQGESHGGVYLIDLESRQVRQTLDWNTVDIDWQGRGWDRGLRGIAFDGETVYIAASDELFAYTPGFRLIGSWRNPYLRHCHEIAVHERRLYLTSTAFDTVLGFDQWPYEGKRVVVFSHRELNDERVEVASGALAPVLSSLAARGSEHVYLDGGQLVQQALKENVVDLLTLSMVPHLLGSGRPLFTQGLPELRLTLLGIQAYPNGMVQLRYQRADSAPGGSGEVGR